MREWNDKYSLVRVLHAIPEGESVDIYFNGTPFFNNLNFTEFSPYVYVPGGKYKVTVYPSETLDKPIIDEEIRVDINELVTIAIIIDEGVPKLLEITEDTEMANGKNSKVRAVHLSPNTPAVNILVDDNILFEDIEYKEVTDYVVVAPKTYKVDIEASENNKLIRSNLITINENRVYSFYAIGNAPNVQIIQSLDGITFMQ